MEKKYSIKVYTNDDAYLTTWQDAINSVEFSNEINTAGSQLNIKLARNAGDYGEGTDVNFNHKVKVYCIDKEDTLGQIVFQGYISSYTPIYKDNYVDVTVLSFGSELSQYMLQNPFDTSKSQINESGEINGVLAPNYIPNGYFGGNVDGAGDWFTAGVKFTTPSDMTSIGKIDVTFHHINTLTSPTETSLPEDVTITLYPLLSGGARSGYPDYDNPLGSVTIPAGTKPNRILDITKIYDGRYADPLVYSFTFEEPVDVNSSTTYVFVLRSDDAGTYSDSYSGLVNGNIWAEWYFDSTEVIMDSYSAYDVPYSMDSSYTIGAAQSFIANSTKYLTKAKFYLDKDGSPTGNAYAKIYNITGTHGSTAIPTGSPIATSDAFNVATLTTSFAWITFNFTGNNRVLLSKNNKYAIALEFSGGNASNYIEFTSQFNGDTHAGNMSVKEAGASNYTITGGYNLFDLDFQVIGVQTLSNSKNYWYYERSGIPSEGYSTTRIMPYSIYQSDGSTEVDYLSQDPSNILIDIIEKYNFLGGSLSYSAGSIDLTGTEVSYNFNSNTILEAIQKVIELCPEGWYWYVDQSTNIIHLHQKNTNPDHLFSLEKDLIDAKFEKRIEDIVNTIYFTGGDIGGGVSFYKKYTNKDSVSKYGVKSMKYIDQRVTVTDTADTIANSILETRSQPELRITLDILDSNNSQSLGYDIESIQVGDVIAVRNVNQQVGLSTWDVARWDESYWDYNIFNLSSLQTQATRINYKEDVLTIEASTMAVDVNKRIEDINRNLETLQTINNPTGPI
jgi:hypothetical protein